MSPQAPQEEVLGVRIHRIPLFVFKCNETEKNVWFAHVPRNSVNAFLSLCSMFFCCYVPAFSAAFRQGHFVRCLFCATRHLHTWINTAQSRLEVPFSCVGKCLGCFTGEQRHADYIPEKIPSPYFAGCHAIVRFRKIPPHCFFWPL